MTKKDKYELSKIPLSSNTITYNGKALTQKEVVDLLNQKDKDIQYLEDTRQRKNKEIAKLKAREEKYQRVIGGLKAYLELECNDDLWWKWNDI